MREWEYILKLAGDTSFGYNNLQETPKSNSLTYPDGSPVTFIKDPQAVARYNLSKERLDNQKNTMADVLNSEGYEDAKFGIIAAVLNKMEAAGLNVDVDKLSPEDIDKLLRRGLDMPEGKKVLDSIPSPSSVARLTEWNKDTRGARPNLESVGDELSKFVKLAEIKDGNTTWNSLYNEMPNQIKDAAPWGYDRVRYLLENGLPITSEMESKARRYLAQGRENYPIIEDINSTLGTMQDIDAASSLMGVGGHRILDGTSRILTKRKNTIANILGKGVEKFNKGLRAINPIYLSQYIPKSKMMQPVAQYALRPAAKLISGSTEITSGINQLFHNPMTGRYNANVLENLNANTGSTLDEVAVRNIRGDNLGLNAANALNDAWTDPMKPIAAFHPAVYRTAAATGEAANNTARVLADRQKNGEGVFKQIGNSLNRDLQMDKDEIAAKAKENFANIPDGAYGKKALAAGKTALDAATTGFNSYYRRPFDVYRAVSSTGKAWLNNRSKSE